MTISIDNLTINSVVYVPPMAGVTDLVFRSLIRKLDPNCLLATEMVSSRGLLNRPNGRIMDLSTADHPIGIQLFGHESDVMAQAAKMAQAAGCDFIDINMGCPVPKITKGSDGCALMREPELARQIVQAVKASVTVPVTVKFRLGWDEQNKNAVEFGVMLQDAGAQAVTVHGRTRAQLYSGQADWNFIAQVKKALTIPVFGNGDVFSLEDAKRLKDITDCDGIAIARGTLGNPWLALRINQYFTGSEISIEPSSIERLAFAYFHAQQLVSYKGANTGIKEARRHVINYTKGLNYGSTYRGLLTQINNLDELAQILANLSYSLMGQSGQSEFLAAIQYKDFHNGKEISKWYSQSESHLQTPI